MECSKDPISVRISRLNSEIVGKAKPHRHGLTARETILDGLLALYEECSLEQLQKTDQNVQKFVQKYRDDVTELKRLRINASDFEIKSVIGRGHFGEVHLVKEKQTGDFYAMKTLRKFEKDLAYLSFEEERDIMAFADSPWLTSLQYAFQDNTYLFLVMEYHPGGDLFGLLSRQGGTLAESAAVFYIAELVLALEDLHKMGYIHRDINVNNVLLDRCGHLKLADFGSAAKLNDNGLVMDSPPVGTPDYIAPEVLQSFDKKDNKNTGYGVSCDFWSLGVLGYVLTVGCPPFAGPNATAVYSKILNHSVSLKFPPEITLSQAFVCLIKSLITDKRSRLDLEGIKRHDLFKQTHFDRLRDQVPPYVPKIKSVEDTSNFSDIPVKKKYPTIDSFKKRSHFSGRNLPFVGFTYTPNIEDSFERKFLVKDEMVEELKGEVAKLRRQAVKTEEFLQEKNCIEKKLEEKTSKVESLENLRDTLERNLASSMAENAALKRTLELERKDRTELEKKALDLIKGAKSKWEAAEKTKVQSLTLEIEQQKEKIMQLTTTNNMLNNQLQHALNLGTKHKESLEKVEHLSRRSVVGLESRLEKVTCETHFTITELQKKLTEEIHQKALLEIKCTELKDKEKVLLERIEESERNFDMWEEKIKESQEVINQLTDQVTLLEHDVQRVSEYKNEIEKLRDVIDSNHKTVKELENRNTMLQSEIKAMEDYKREIQELKKMIGKLENDKKVAKLESELIEQREKCEALKKQLQESDNILTENQELKELRLKYWRMEKELTNAKIDKRIVERELKDTRCEIVKLKEEIDEFDKRTSEMRKIHENALLELNSINESITMELVKTKETNKNLLERLEMNKQKFEEESLIVRELKSMVNSKDDKICSLNMELSAARKDKMAMEAEVEKAKVGMQELQECVRDMQKEKEDLYHEFDKAKRQIENTNLNLNALREACTLLENQVIEYEKIKVSFEAKCSELNSNTEALIRDLCNAKQEIQEAKRQTNEEKSLKLMAEAKLKRRDEEIEDLRGECSSYKCQCEEYKTYSTKVSEELNLAEEKITNLEVTVTSLQRQLDDLRTELRIIKQENSSYLTELNQVKESYYKAKHHLKELKEEKYSLLQQLNELEVILNERNNFYKEREMKAEATIKQQIKLIDYLQSKIDELGHKKKTFTEVLFGNSKKENQPPISLAMNYKQLESQLSKEKQRNAELQQEIYKLKAATAIETNRSNADKLNKIERQKSSEVMSPLSKIAMEQIVNSPSKQKNDLYRHPSLQRMHHNIPHRFETWLCTKTTKCAGCSELISLARSAYMCSECNAAAHSNCAKRVPNTCGLPQPFAKHYKDSLEIKKGDDGDALNKAENGDVNVEGWIKVPGKSGGWERHFARLTDTTLRIYGGPEKCASLLETFELKPENSHGRVVLEPLPSEVPVPVAASDLPFVIKIEVSPDATCWPPKCFLFMTLSAQEKDKWFSALQKIYYGDLNKHRLEKVLSLPENVEAYTIVELCDSIRLLGTSMGLYAHHEDELFHLDGFAEVHNISVMRTTKNVLMVVDAKRRLVVCDLNHLINIAQCARCNKQTAKFVEVNVNNLNNFHMLETSPHAKQQKACVATSKQLVILDCEPDTNVFVTISIIDTAQPTSCLMFTENSLLVGTDKFFEIDLNTFEAEEFLDDSDVRLRHVQKCHKVGSFPTAILQITKNPREYLLCFNEFSVFIDEYGRSTRRSEIKWRHVPLAFHYARSFLYVVQFSSIDIVRINEDTCNSSDDLTELDSTELELEKPECVGTNSRGIYVLIGREIKFVDARKVLDEEEGLSESESDRFSFSSSIMHSLDGNISDTEERTRRVKFASETEL